MFKRQAFCKHGRFHETISEDIQAVSERIEKRCYLKFPPNTPSLPQPTRGDTLRPPDHSGMCTLLHNWELRLGPHKVNAFTAPAMVACLVREGR